MPDPRTRVLLAAAFASALSGAAMAQTAPNGTTAPAGSAPAMDAAKPANSRVEKHLADLHKRLGITAAEEPQWNEFATVARGTGQDQDAALEANRTAIPNQTAPQIMKGYADLISKQGQDLQTVSAAFDKLYASFPPDQQKAADTSFQTNGMRRVNREASRGH